MAELEAIKINESKKMEGEVVSDKMDKTIVVEVTRTLKHPVLGKVIKRSKKYKVHDEKNSAKVGNWVEFAECRPLSKTKHMVLCKIIRSSN
ncbi:TPA: 30S ribosomal protein S17 [Candidatus Dependentiae bacterium]|nr:MAG: 30S ribosomal protein S17 [candidate division TM6 bacterium GW2011_GWE2_31_21]KKP53118.1 MAG: 30S ribosomal protein S17 [candidate division TM6 bacterium GW2011_GWF2_33_332]HBS47937.1 30S ribosomal protein S17 [Candidatus Dependentiae bacterium]HBZ73459.1 30S ribosomal protein S17 [Candidatus Dependentiae bacterium]